MNKRDIENDKKTLEVFSKDTLIERILLLQEYIKELKNNNNELKNKIEENVLYNKKLEKLEHFEPLLKEFYPILLKMIRVYEDNNSKRLYKGYGLVKVPSKKHGFLYYVRYYDNGKMIPTKWNTNTNDLDEAKIYAEKYRIYNLDGYYKKQSLKDIGIKKTGNMYKILSNIYSKDSLYLEYFEQLNITINNTTKTYYNNIINKIFIPYLIKNKIKTFSEITVPVIVNFQISLKENNKNSNLIRRYLRALEYAFSNLMLLGFIETNVFEKVPKIKGKK
jgi:FtsZ-binding cell division protein ZapB